MKTIDMTKGNVTGVLIRFALPLMLGDLFQQMYVSVDSIILGQFAGPEPLAAAGSTIFLIRLIIGLFTGISAGASVVIAQCTGAKNSAKLEKAVHTLASLTLIGGSVLTVIGVGLSPVFLHVLGTPANIVEQADLYLKIYFSGSLAELTYNVGSGILQASGDTKRPFIFLLISSAVNIVLDYVFIAIFGWGTAGAAWATVIAQCIAAALIVAALVRSKAGYKLNFSKIRIEKSLVPNILQMGLPAGFQNAIVSLSNVIIQWYINAAGSAAVGGFGVFNKIDGIIMLPLNSIALAAMTFAGQNTGAGKSRRIVSGIKTVFILEGLAWALGMGICLVFRENLFKIFTDDTEIIRYAVLTMEYDMPFYWALGTGCAMTSIIRGMGHSKAASVILIVTMCILRQIFIYCCEKAGGGLHCVLVSYPVSWILLLAGALLYTLYLNRSGEFKNLCPADAKGI